MWIFTLLAASRIVVPAGTETASPLIVTVTLAIEKTPYSLMIALNGQLEIHAPHLMHFAGSITCFSLTLPTIASTGQKRAHFVHPLHASVIVSV
jgi:hypothetical protein